MYTQEEAERFKIIADKWYALDEKIGRIYGDEDSESDDENQGDLLQIGEMAAIAFGYL